MPDRKGKIQSELDKEKSEKEVTCINFKENCTCLMSFFEKVILPIAILFAGYLIQDAIKEKDIRLALIQTSVQILSEKPNERKVPIRKWAIDIINKYSAIKFDNKTEKLLLYDEPLRLEMKEDLEMRDDLEMK